MKLTPRQYAELLFTLTHGAKRAEVSERVKSFLQLLVRHRTLSFLPRILQSFAEVWDDHTDTLRVRVASAKPLAATAKSALRKAFDVGFVELEETVDPTLIGGLRLHIKDTIVDGSIRASLDSLRNSLVV